MSKVFAEHEPMSLAEENGIKYVVMDETNGPEAFEILTKVFAEHEPMMKHLQVTVADSKAVFKPYWTEFYKSELSIVAIDTASNKVVGALTAKDPAIAGHWGVCQ